jgi:hypothetical protein
MHVNNWPLDQLRIQTNNCSPVRFQHNTQLLEALLKSPIHLGIVRLALAVLVPKQLVPAGCHAKSSLDSLKR